MNKFVALSLLAISINTFAMAGKPQVEEPVVATEQNSDKLAKTTEITSPEAVSTVNLSQILPKYHWRLVSAQDVKSENLKGVIVEGTPNIEMMFIDNSISIRNTCNQMMASYTVDASGTQLQFGQIAQTMRACVDPEMALKDDAMIALLSNLKTVNIDQAADNGPIALSMIDQNGNLFRFNGVLTPESYFGQAGKEMFLEISPQHVACDLPVANSQCIQIREIVYDESFRQSVPDPTWIVYPNAIDGFNHEAGLRNIVRVKRFTHSSETTPTDTSRPDPFYVLELVVESSIVNP